jgi:23S rRNA (adenine2503-C2)-methyltransferase
MSIAISDTSSNAPSLRNLLDLDPDEALVGSWRVHGRRSAKPATARAQVFARLWQRPVHSFDDMTELPKALRQQLAEHASSCRDSRFRTRQRSTDGTEKFLFRLHDGQAIETVAIPDGDRLTLCISSQAGCALQCAFCATGRHGLPAQPAAESEIAGQVRELRLLDPPRLATNIVFMGMGEPLMNWPAVDVALTLLNDPRALGIGARHITVSTVGVLPGIEALGARRGAVPAGDLDSRPERRCVGRSCP